MLTTLPQGDRPRPRVPRRPPRSLRQEYHEFILQRIEEYKDTLPREELLVIGDEAVRELEASAQDQYLLTEVLLLEHVDRIIARRLRLPSFGRWRLKHRRLREAQRQPTHWGLDPQGSVARLAQRLDPGDLAVVVGAAAVPVALFLAAYDVEVLLLDQDLGAVEAAESRAVSEQLAGRFQALVVQFGTWVPDLLSKLVVFDPVALVPARSRDRLALIADLQARTRPGGLHVILPTSGGGEERRSHGVIPLAAESLQAVYGGWEIEPEKRARRRGGAGSGFVATKPARQADTRASVSD